MSSLVIIFKGAYNVIVLYYEDDHKNNFSM